MIDSSAIDEKIIAMDLWHLALPVQSQRDHGIGSVADSIEVVVVKLTAESGVFGFGEASPWSVFTGTPEANFAGLDRYLRPLIVGSRIGDWRDTMTCCQRTLVHCYEAKAALETAFVDLAGKLTFCPGWALLGDQCRDKIPLSVSIANPQFAQDLELIERIYDAGVRIVKFKTGFKDHEFDLMRVRQVRNDYPDMRIRIDYNQGLDVDDALTQVMDIDSLEPEFIEQPVRADEYECMALLREKMRSPLLADESVFGPEDLRRALRESICDGVSVKIMKAGGLTRGMAVAQMAADGGLSAYGGDMFETGLAHLAGVHMIAASPNISLGCEFYQASWYLVDDLLTEPFPVVDGAVMVPTGPGLGMQVDEDKLRKYALRTALDSGRSE